MPPPRYQFKTSEQRSKIMSRIRSKDTKPEIKLRKLLWSIGIRYRLNVKKLPGSPDILINKHKLAIFVDGEFWHGYNWEQKKDSIKSNRDYWIPKIEKNIARDTSNNSELEYRGYTVLRFWESDINKNPGSCLNQILEEIDRKDGLA